MPSSAAQSIRIDPELLIGKYERARQEAGIGIGDRRWRLTPSQHLDVHRLVAALRAKGGIAVAGAELDVWVNYLAPVMAESGPAKRLLQKVLSDMQDAHAPREPIGAGTGGTSPGGASTADGGKRSGPSWSWVALIRHLAIASAVVAIIGGAFYFFLPPRQQTTTAHPPPPPPVEPVPQSRPRGLVGRDAAARAFTEAWSVTTVALGDQSFMSGGLTPRRFAAAHVSAEPLLGSPDVLLANLLRAWPMPPDEAISIEAARSPAAGNAGAADGRGLWTLRRLTAEVAVLRSGLPRIVFEDLLQGGVLPTRVAPPLTPAVSTHLAGPRWSNEQLLLLAGAPLLVYFIVVLATHRRRVRALMDRWLAAERRWLRTQRVLEGIKQTSAPLLAAPPRPFVEREPLRSLARYRPVAGHRLDAPRSIAALMRQEGVADPVMRRVQRAVSYLVIIQRRQPHDHERLRLRRLFADLAERGLPFFAYDYERDPLTVKHAVAARGSEQADGVNGREEALALSTLRDLHPEARLVLVTDGRDLVDRVSGRVRADIAKMLSFWRERVVLTPVPVGDWGEVELALSRDLDAPLGRADENALPDLTRGFRSTRLHRLALAQARAAPNLGARLDTWWQAISDSFGFGAILSRGSALSFDQRLLATDLPPPPAMIETIRNDLYRWLGRRGFLWHAACAIYPQLRFDLTVHIGRVLRSGPQPDAPILFRDTPEDRRTFDRMTALPWFRSGRMPDWLRRDMLQEMEPDARERAAAVIRDLFKPGTETQRQGPLAIWWPRTGALAMPPDPVMADTLLGGSGSASVVVPPQRDTQLRAAAGRMQLVREAKSAIVVALVCAGLWFFAPDLSATPHPRGAWLPLFSFASACAAVLVALLYARKQWPAVLPAPPPRELAPPPPESSPTAQSSERSAESSAQPQPPPPQAGTPAATPDQTTNVRPTA